MAPIWEWEVSLKEAVAWEWEGEASREGLINKEGRRVALRAPRALASLTTGTILLASTMGVDTIRLEDELY